MLICYGAWAQNWTLKWGTYFTILSTVFWWTNPPSSIEQAKSVIYLAGYLEHKFVSDFIQRNTKRYLTNGQFLTLPCLACAIQEMNSGPASAWNNVSVFMKYAWLLWQSTGYWKDQHLYTYAPALDEPTVKSSGWSMGLSLSYNNIPRPHDQTRLLPTINYVSIGVDFWSDGSTLSGQMLFQYYLAACLASPQKSWNVRRTLWRQLCRLPELVHCIFPRMQAS